MAKEFQKTSILIVDDTETNIRLLAHVIKGEGYEVMACFSGKEALEMLDKRKPDLILLDVMMPEMDGFEVCEKIKAQKKFEDIPVIFLSALSETHSKVKGFKVGGVDYITKPFQRQEVLARIDLHIKLKKLQKKLRLNVAELQQRETLLRRLNNEKDELMRIVSHDFRNPVTGIVGLIDILKGDDLGTVTKEEIYEAIQESGEKLIALVNNLLEKNSETSISELDTSRVNLTELIEDTVELHRPTAINKGISIDKELDSISDFTLDRYKIEQVLSNLLSNALKFTPEDGTISVRLNKIDNDPQQAKIEVSDTGIGISESDMQTIWDNDSTKSRVGTSGEKGSGIGLTLVKNFVDLHKGNIEVQTTEEKGTTFILLLPEASK